MAAQRPSGSGSNTPLLKKLPRSFQSLWQPGDPHRWATLCHMSSPSRFSCHTNCLFGQVPPCHATLVHAEVSYLLAHAPGANGNLGHWLPGQSSETCLQGLPHRGVVRGSSYLGNHPRRVCHQGCHTNLACHRKFNKGQTKKQGEKGQGNQCNTQSDQSASRRTAFSFNLLLLLFQLEVSCTGAFLSLVLGTSQVNSSSSSVVQLTFGDLLGLVSCPGPCPALPLAGGASPGR